MPPEGEAGSSTAPQSAGNNSSDFVRKLYKMLEDPQYSEVVRWGDQGDSFVVLENEKFTKTILPKHFKHSNFASFVRQLNKYDFHKVRHNDESGQSPYGQSAWEFRHPEFRADRKDNLDNIRRKAPAPRKPQVTDDQQTAATNQQVIVLGETLAATQHQIQQLQEQYNEMIRANGVLAEEILHLQKLVGTQHRVQNELINHLSKIEQDRRENRNSNSSNHSTPAGYNANGGGNYMSDGSPETAADLRQVRDLLNSVSVEHSADHDLKRMSIAYAHQSGASPDSATSSSMMAPPGPNGFNNPYVHDPMNDMRHLVYPVGQTIGIDPFAAEHMGNIPYNRPVPEQTMNAGSEVNLSSMHAQTPTPGPSQSGSGVWGMKKPVILLVEDDKTCSRIGSKFLAQYECGVEVARNGVEAVGKVNSRPDYYDLIFMDIIMPQLDGVSATAMIRQVREIPIIAMTSNINQQDLDTYYHWGMRDVLAKPFTKEGMLGKVRKHLAAYLRNPPPEAMLDMFQNGGGNQQPTQSPYQNQGMGMPLSATSSTGVGKFDTTPIQSPATSTSWNSPSQVPHASPVIGQDQGYMNAGGGPQMGMNTGGNQKPQQHQNHMSAMGGSSHQHRLSDGLPPEKRQRVFGPQGGYQ